MKIILIRHGETDYNKEPMRYQGQVDIELNEEGLRQVDILAENIKNLEFTKVFCSDLSRAKKTCDIIIKKNNNFHKEPFFNKEIREKDMGDLEGTYIKDRIFKRDVAIKGENRIQFYHRVSNFFENLIKNSELEDNILIVTHGGVIGNFVIWADKKYNLNYLSSERIKNSSLWELEILNNKAQWKIINKTY